jgi:hypothetical protein
MINLTEQTKLVAQQILGLSKEEQLSYWEEHIVNGWFGRNYKSEHAKKCAFTHWIHYQQRLVAAPVGSEVHY